MCLHSALAHAIDDVYFPCGALMPLWLASLHTETAEMVITKSALFSGRNPPKRIIQVSTWPLISRLWLHFALAYLGASKTCIQHKWGMVRYQQLWLFLLHVVCSCIPANLRCRKDQESMMLQKVKCQRGTATHRQWSAPISEGKWYSLEPHQCKQATSKPVYQTSF